MTGNHASVIVSRNAACTTRLLTQPARPPARLPVRPSARPQSSPELIQSAFALDSSSGSVRREVLTLEVHRALAMAVALAPRGGRAGALRVAVIGARRRRRRACHRSNPLLYTRRAHSCLGAAPPLQGFRLCAVVVRSRCVTLGHSVTVQLLTLFFSLSRIAGAGACALPSAIAFHLPSASITAVELDAEVLTVARAHFDAGEGAGVRLVAADGADYLRGSADGSFDVIIVDAASPSSAATGGPAAPALTESLQAPPPPLASGPFLADLARALAPGGLAAVNVFGTRGAERRFEARTHSGQAADRLRRESGRTWLGASLGRIGCVRASNSFCCTSHEPTHVCVCSRAAPLRSPPPPYPRRRPRPRRSAGATPRRWTCPQTPCCSCASLPPSPLTTTAPNGSPQTAPAAVAAEGPRS